MKCAIILFAFLFLCAYTNYVYSQPFINKETRIFHGNKAKPGQFPWHVGIKINFGNGVATVCGGALIHNNFILTAAHCMSDNFDSFELRFGSTSFTEGGVLRTAKKYLKHEDFDQKWLYNDVAVIYVEDGVDTTDEIKTIDLPQPGDVLTKEDKVIATGYGLTESGYHNDLNYIEVESITNEECKRSFGFLKDDQMCCVGEGGKTTCHGDSGGPLFKLTKEGAVHVGISSFVHNSGCESNKPFAFARTETFSRWIVEAMHKLINS